MYVMEISIGDLKELMRKAFKEGRRLEGNKTPMTTIDFDVWWSINYQAIINKQWEKLNGG